MHLRLRMLPASCARDSARGGTRRMESTRGGGGREGNCAREREREWYGSWQCQCLRRCTEALSENGRRLSVFRLYRKNGFVSRVRRTSRSLRGLPQWTSINFQAFPVALRLLSFLSLSPLPPLRLLPFFPPRKRQLLPLSLSARWNDRSIDLSVCSMDRRDSFLFRNRRWIIICRGFRFSVLSVNLNFDIIKIIRF